MSDIPGRPTNPGKSDDQICPTKVKLSILWWKVDLNINYEYKYLLWRLNAKYRINPSKIAYKYVDTKQGDLSKYACSRNNTTAIISINLTIMAGLLHWNSMLNGFKF